LSSGWSKKGSFAITDMVRTALMDHLGLEKLLSVIGHISLYKTGVLLYLFYFYQIIF